MFLYFLKNIIIHLKKILIQFNINSLTYLKMLKIIKFEFLIIFMILKIICIYIF